MITTQSRIADANITSSNLKSGTDFSIAAIMARDELSRESSEYSISKIIRKVISDWLHNSSTKLWQHRKFNLFLYCVNVCFVAFFNYVPSYYKIVIFAVVFARICSELIAQRFFYEWSWFILTNSGPGSVNRFAEGDDELDVDVEQCSDSEALSRSRTPRTASNNSRGTTPSPSDDERLTPEPVSNFLMIDNADSSYYLTTCSLHAE